MKNIYINPIFYIVSLIMLVTGFFKPFLFMIIYLLIHEFGHILIGYLLGFKVIRINIYPCGLLTIFNMKINDSIFKDFLIALSGPLFQILGYFFIKKYYSIHLFLLVFNLLPIYPLDGSKIFSDLLPHLKEKALIAFEIGMTQAPDLINLTKEYLPTAKYEVKKDLSDKDRMFFIFYNEKSN